MRRPKIDPSIEAYLTSLSDGPLLSLILKGHLVVEALLVEIAQTLLPSERPWKWNFPQKVQFCLDKKLILSKEADAALSLNDMRNDFGHVLGHEVTFSRVHSLVLQMRDFGFDFPDSTMYADPKTVAQYHDETTLMFDVVNAIFFELAQRLVEAGGANRAPGTSFS